MGRFDVTCLFSWGWNENRTLGIYSGGGLLGFFRFEGFRGGFLLYLFSLCA
jgi:hypothetical protein